MGISADLRGKAALVTGGATGIGLATAASLARCGAKVAVNYLPGDNRGADAVATLQGEGLDIVPAEGNAAAAGECEAMVEGAIARLGRLDILINNAGVTGTVEPIPFPELERMTDEFWLKILDTNLVGPFRASRAAAPALRAAKGAIVNTCSVAGLGRRGSSIAYAASKAGLINLTKSLARALAPDVRVNGVAPGLIETPLTAAWPESRRDLTRSRTILGRTGTPEDVAEAMLFLAAGAAYITGEVIAVDGGSQ
ncbi:SDR family NAD(P)-dependent oxidoreductase [Enterovirga rhinocerotis]|uniref:3-oxoacyl-[acyl-carrier protein] reductase n=1 Tax=Enterovirga rhinocerotis TaxID=1339210 RepID=A0A4V3DXU1_9HYPH|nr:SDR family oxidoreductase [Enterovirga rhinocerotis]TDR90049.1 3-oxoacyl-[acyl-carrier protein] reductase [Enterovirga rhinocerotis]